MSLEKDINSIMEAGIFKPASKKEVAQRRPPPPSAPTKKEIQAIEKILDMFFYDEETHWESYSENPAERPNDHIYNYLKTLAEYIGWAG